MIRLREKMTLPSRVRYLLWRAGLTGKEVVVRLATGQLIVLDRSMQMSSGTAYEVFVSDVYRSPRKLDPRLVRRIVDVGANVGFSVAYFAAVYPSARIDAFEPHPAHLATLRKTVGLNLLCDRVNIRPVAVGCEAGEFALIDAGVCSNILNARSAHGSVSGSDIINVRVVDFFSEIAGNRVDLLKMDCEGAEYDILMDRRFTEIEVKAIVLEWHATTARPKADREILHRLQSVGWHVVPTSPEFPYPVPNLGILRAGMLWAYR